MSKRPLAITVISWIFIVFGSIALLVGLLPNAGTSVAQRLAEVPGHWFVHLSRIVMILCGVLMVYGSNWGRWLLVPWLLFHLVISILHSPFQLLVHSLIFAVIVYFVFGSRSSAYFRAGTKSEPPAVAGG